MKKCIAATFIAVTVLGTLNGCSQNTDIGKDEATKIALDDAGLSESDVSRLLVSKEKDNGQSLYEVEFTNDNIEYDYEILASSGEIINSGVEKISTTSSNTDQTTTSENSQSQTDQQNDASQSQTDNSQVSAQTNVQISQEEAIKLALERVPGATEQDLKIKLEFDDNSYKYEGDIIYDQTEYEFEIDANTGTFLEWSEERK